MIIEGRKHKNIFKNMVSQPVHQWKVYSNRSMVQTPITPPRIKESRLLRKLIFWMRLLMAGKRSEGWGSVVKENN